MKLWKTAKPWPKPVSRRQTPDMSRPVPVLVATHAARGSGTRRGSVASAHASAAPRSRLPAASTTSPARGNRRQAIYHDDDDRRLVPGASRTTSLGRYGWRLHAYCLMTNHFHLLVETPDAESVALGMHRLKSEYATYFNERHAFRRATSSRQRFGRGSSRPRSTSASALRYIAFNPVQRRPLCRIRQSGRGAASTESPSRSTSTDDGLTPEPCPVPDTGRGWISRSRTCLGSGRPGDGRGAPAGRPTTFR